MDSDSIFAGLGLAAITVGLSIATTAVDSDLKIMSVVIAFTGLTILAVSYWKARKNDESAYKKKVHEILSANRLNANTESLVSKTDDLIGNTEKMLSALRDTNSAIKSLTEEIRRDRNEHNDSNKSKS